MTVSQIVKIILISMIIIGVFFLLLNIVLAFKRKATLKTLSKKQRKKKKLIKQSIKKNNRWVFINLLLSVFLMAGYYLFVSYENSNINGEDSDSVVRAYFLVEDFSKEIEKAAAKETDRDASIQNIKYLTLSMSTYANKTSSDSNTVEGQKLINRYYSSIGQLGMNASRDIKSFYGNENDVLESYKNELKQLKTAENKVFDFYKVNSNALENEKNKKD